VRSVFDLKRLSLVVFLCVPLAAHVQAQEDDGRDVSKEEVTAGFQLLNSQLEEVSASPAAMALSSTEEDIDPRNPRLFPRNSDNEVSSQNGVLDHTLNIEYHTHKIFNPKQKDVVDVKLRSYNGKLHGAPLVVSPGDTMNITLTNKLPDSAETTCEGTEGGDDEDPIDPANFNVTNLHTHGLHVSPAGNSDNVLIAVPPGKQFENEIKLPRHHAPGTFWYHAHVHGSTAIQATSGMAGPLIVQGGLDDLEKLKDAPDYIMMFQQIPYVPSEENEDLYEVECYDQFGNSQWQPGVESNGWRTMINGWTQPHLIARPGQVMRWRMIHAGFRETISVSVVPFENLQQSMAAQADAVTDSDDPTSLAAVASRKAEVLEPALDLHEVAADALAYGFDWTRKEIELEPGYRSDVLVRIDEPGLYVMVDNEVSAENSLQGRYEFPKVLAYVIVLGDPAQDEFPTNEEMKHLRVHKSIEDDEVIQDENQSVTFDLFTIDGEPFSKNVVRKMKLGTVYEWDLKSNFVNHPFHIHVNPFEITHWEERNEEGDMVNMLPIIDGERQTIWKDTILVKGPIPRGSPSPQTLKVRSRNERYIGRFVLHCHILDHEDKGMMQIVEITPPGDAHQHHHQ